MDKMIQLIYSQLQQANWDMAQQTRLQQLSQLFHNTGWCAMDDTPEGTANILKQNLQQCEKINTTKQVRHGAPGEGQTH
eukprot:c34387_g1_i1 orf=37-273(-)